jgi:hypothetical protein
LPSTATLIRELRGAKEGRPRRKVIRGMVSELARLMHAPEKVPAPDPVPVAVGIPAGLEQASEVIDPGAFYELEVDGGYIELDGVELVAMCRNLIELAEAQTAGDESAAERALSRLCGPWSH